MPSFDRLRNLLPSLYRPEDDDVTLLAVWLRAVGSALDGLQGQSTGVMQSHWLPYADQAMYNPWFLRSRDLARPPKPYPQPGDPDLAQFPYIDDLARLGALIPVAPWEQPPQLRDLVEDYRLRILRLVEVYRNGLGTLDALQRMVEAQLPANQAAPPGRRDRPFWIEEFAPSATTTYPVPARGEPLTMVGPLMRFTIDNGSLDSVPPVVYIQGVAPQPNASPPKAVDATVNPMVELYQAGATRPRLGLAYADTVAPGQTLRLRPAANSWLGMDSGIVRAQSLPPEGGFADPSAPGPWQPVAGGPAGPVAAIHQTRDLSLFVASNAAAGGGILARFDGTTWSNVLAGVPRIGVLNEDGDNLLIGTDTGLLRMPLSAPPPAAPLPVSGLHVSEPVSPSLLSAVKVAAPTVSVPLVSTQPVATPPTVAPTVATPPAAVPPVATTPVSAPPVATPPTAAPPASTPPPTSTPPASTPSAPIPPAALPAVPEPALAGHKVLAIFRAANNRIWFGTDSGAFFQDPGGAVQPTVLQGVAVNAIAQDENGVLYFGTALGLFQWQPGADSWNWYEGQNFGEENPNWQPFFPAKQGAGRNFPAAGQPFLPPITCVLCDRRASVWVGTQNGIARYTALENQDLDMQTALEAFPDLTTGPVFAIREDPRGLLWFATDRGLFRYDGRDWWQFQSGAWVQLWRADTLYPAGVARGQWRFDRTSAQWQRLDGSWIAFTPAPAAPAPAINVTSEHAVYSIAWTGAVVADLGQWNGSSFSNPAAVDSGKLRVRLKPNEQTIVNGGIPALPRLPRGSSVWRYLSMEAGNPAAPGATPWWSSEGCLFPPPPNLDAPGEGRFDMTAPPPESDFDRAVFPYNPAALVWFEWQPKRPLSVLVRLKKVAPNETIDPAIVDRVWQGIQQVRPAGVAVRLAVEEDIVKS